MSETKPSEIKVEEKQDDEDKSEVLGNLVKVVVLYGLPLYSRSHTLDFPTVKRF